MLIIVKTTAYMQVIGKVPSCDCTLLARSLSNYALRRSKTLGCLATKRCARKLSTVLCDFSGLRLFCLLLVLKAIRALFRRSTEKVVGNTVHNVFVHPGHVFIIKPTREGKKNFYNLVCHSTEV